MPPVQLITTDPASTVGRDALRTVLTLAADYTDRRVAETNEIHYAQVGEGCDGAPAVNLLAGGAGSCEVGSGPISAVALKNGAAIPLGPPLSGMTTPRVFRGSGGAGVSTGISLAPGSTVAAAASLRERIRFVDDKGNFFNWDGAYLGAAATFGYSFPAITDTAYYSYISEEFRNIVGRTAPAPALWVSTGVEYSGYGGLDEVYAVTPARDSAIFGTCVLSGGGYLNNAGKVFGLEAYNGSELPGYTDDAWWATVRDGLGNFDVLSRVPAQFAAQGFVNTGRAYHASATEEGSWWTMQSIGGMPGGRGKMFRWLWTGSAVAFSEAVDIGSGGTAWTSTTRCSAILLPA